MYAPLAAVAKVLLDLLVEIGNREDDVRKALRSQREDLPLQHRDPSIGIMGFGIFGNSSESRVPRPPAIIIVFIASYTSLKTDEKSALPVQ